MIDELLATATARREAAGSRAARHTGRALAGILIVLMGTGAAAQRSPADDVTRRPTPSSPVARLGPATFRFRHLTNDDGLSQASVYTVLQDSRGFIWLGTQDGLNRYDGERFVVYRHDPEQSGSLSHSYVRAVFEDSKARLWIGTEQGLNRFDRKREAFVRYLRRPADRARREDDVRDIAEDRDGGIWIATMGNGVKRLDPDSGRFQEFVHDAADPGSLASDLAGSLWPRSDGRIWVGTRDGLDLLDPESGRVEHVRHDPADPASLTGDEITALGLARDGRLWVGTSTGLNLLDPVTRRVERFRHDPDDPVSLGGDHVRAIATDRRGLVWVGTAQSGLSVLNPKTGRFTRFRADLLDDDMLQDDLITSIHEDAGGIIWVGTEGAGVALAQALPIPLFRHHASDAFTLSSNLVWGFADRRDGLVWVATGKGLDLIDPASGVTVRFGADADESGGVSSGNIRALELDRSGRLWAGVTGAGLYGIDQVSGQIVHFRHHDGDPSSLANDNVLALLEGRQGALWVGTEGGLSRFDPDRTRFTSFRHDPLAPWSLGANEVRALCEDRAGRLWVGTRDGGLNRFDPDSGGFVRYQNNPRDPASLSLDKVWSIHEDRQGRLWVGTLGGGLNQLDPATGRVHRYTTKHGLPNNVVYGILEDRQGMLWLSTNRGIARFDPATEEVTTFGVSDGLQGLEFNSGAFHRSSDGRLWFGGLHGANVIDPDQPLRSDYEPRLVISSIWIDGDQAAPGETPDGLVSVDSAAPEATLLRLGPSHGHLEIQFASLDYASRRRMRYAYRLAGFDRDWNTSAIGIASYTNVPPGRYTFQARGSSANGTWSRDVASIAVTIEPPFWRTWWFFGAVGLFVLAAIGTWYRVNVWAVARRADRLEREVRIRTKEIREQIETIAQQKTHLERAMAELGRARSQLVTQAHQAGMAEIATGVLHNIGNLQNSIATSCSLIRSLLCGSKRSGLGKANALLRANAARLGEFLERDERGRRLPEYLARLEAALGREHQALLDEADRLAGKVAAVSEVIASQQEIAAGRAVEERLHLTALVDQALTLEAASLEHHGIAVVKAYGDLPVVVLDKSKMMQVLVNLITNAKEAMSGVAPGQRTLTIRLEEQAGTARVVVGDTGCGIAAADLERIFSYGFTTKPSGHGFGLHSSFNYMTEMGGRLRVESEGAGLGATFILTLPLADERTGRAAA